MPIVQFSGETNYDSVINYYGLDLEEEDRFRLWLTAHGVPSNATRDRLQDEYLRFSAPPYLGKAGLSPGDGDTPSGGLDGFRGGRYA